MSNKLVLYNTDFSSPVRAVKIVAKILGLELDVREVDLWKREQLSEWFLKLNPEHTVPTLVDGDFSIWDSHSICMYLVDKYAKNDSLYPKDLQLRAKCNQRLFFDQASLYTKLRECSMVIHMGGKEIPQDKLDALHESLVILEAFLATDPFLVGDSLTIADVCAAENVLPMEMYITIDADKYPKILAWIERIRKETPYLDEVNANLIEEYRQIMYGIWEKNKQQ